MNTCSFTCCWNTREIKDKVPHLAVEDVGRSPVQVGSIVWIAIYKSKPGEPGGRFKYWWRVRVTNELRVVVVDD